MNLPQKLINLSTSKTSTDTCPKCDGKGIYFYEDAMGYLFSKPCDLCNIYKERDIQHRLDIAQLPSLYAETTLKDLRTDVYATDEAKAILKNAAKGVKWWLSQIDNPEYAGKGLYLVSNTKGTGKTMCACAIANELIRNRGKRVKYISQNKILENIKASWDDMTREGSEIVILNNLKSIDYLIIDEFGETRASDWVNEKFYSILNARYEGKKPTIFTSNITLSEAKAVGYDERILDRIAGTCGVIPFPNESVRRNNLNDFQVQMQKAMGGF